ncbi:MAG: transcription antitermination factor NusB [Bacteroidetes bacterium]|nr:MAG: transcription antitermination factor NusB [Bacteroidota bacterium]
MISRRQLRIKALQSLYAYYKNGRGEIASSEKALHDNINKAYELYHYLLILVVDVALYAESRIEIARNKRIPTREDLHPNTRFIDNRLLYQIRNNTSLLRFVEQHKLNWSCCPELLKECYGKLVESDFYQSYMEAEECSYAADKKLITDFYTHVVYPSELLSSLLEEQSIYWNDDLEFIIHMILKTIRKYREGDGDDHPLMALYKNSEDSEYVLELFRQTIVHRDEYVDYIKQNTRNWDLERIAFMDILIMQMALAELVAFPSIPTKVTLNEYLEISKFYSTSRSSVFINGVLDKVVLQLKEEKKFQKSGRGLVGENE